MTTRTVPDHTPHQRAAKRAEPRMPRAPEHAPPRSDIRKDVVARARRLLRQGYYENSYTLDFAIARMLDEAMSGRAAPKRATGATPGRQAAHDRDQS